MKIEDFIGLEILTGDAMQIGNVEGIGIDVTTWTVPALKIGLRKGLEENLGIKKARFGSKSIYVRSEGIDSISDMITLTKELKEVPAIMMESEEDIPTAGSVVGTRVIARGGRQLGYVDNFIFAPEKGWGITHMLVKVEKAVLSDLGMKKQRLGTPTIKILSEDIKTIGDMVMLKIDMGELKDHLEKKPRKKREEPEVAEPLEPIELQPIEEGGNTLPFQVNKDFSEDEAEQRARRLESL